MRVLSQVRGRLPQLQQDRHAFIHNSLQISTVRLRIDKSTPLSEIAYQNRKAIIQAADPKDIEISLAVTREMVRRGQPTHICEPFEKSYFVTNWTAAWKGLDFSPAIREQKKGGSSEADLKLFVLGDCHVEGGPQRCKRIPICCIPLTTLIRFGIVSSTILCKTAEGYWSTFGVAQKTSKVIHEYLEKDPMLENF